MNDRNCRYDCLANPVFLDMMFANTVSRRGSRCAQVYATNVGWGKIFPMASRSETHETLLLLFTRDGLPLACICDNANEMVKGSFTRVSKMLHVI